MTDQSPWRTLAERLGCLPKNHKPEDPVLILLGNRWTPPSDKDAQDLLIGRALRVAKEWEDENGSRLLNKDWVMHWTRLGSYRGEHRALAALELLDAVGYNTK